MKITLSQLRRIIKEEVETIFEAKDTASRVSYNPRKPWANPSYLEDLMNEIGASSPSEIDFGQGRTPYGVKIMAGLAGSGELTHFWDSDDGWQSMPMPFGLVDTKI